ncbi:MAG: septum site-determining protein MinC [Xenococcaceae cyanobacterium MO_207.B15]|nr:septum site-determining protein MinC [Xenococcaceae cyanobacterium MO_207.B15]MDJ0746221.1 septum site-determining protein MinC [Xenococcaceae cyanobacterium MO_167.B27]
MVVDPKLSLDWSSDTPVSPLVERYSQIRLKQEGDSWFLVLPNQSELEGKSSWSELWQELKHYLQGREKSWQPRTSVSLLAQDQLLDVQQLQTLAEILEEAELCLETVVTTRRQTAVAAATGGYCVEQNKLSQLSLTPGLDTTTTLAEPLYFNQTVRSGIELRHEGSIIIFGDLNPGGLAIAVGDIFVWGRLRGLAHAGAKGNRKARIMALQMEFTQLRIADLVARSPKFPPKTDQSEVAFIAGSGICLAKAVDFAKTHKFSEQYGIWIDR